MRLASDKVPKKCGFPVIIIEERAREKKTMANHSIVRRDLSPRHLQLNALVTKCDHHHGLFSSFLRYK